MRFFTSGTHRYFQQMMQKLPHRGHDPGQLTVVPAKCAKAEAGA